MRLSILILFLIFSDLLFSQQWQPAEWITTSSQRDTGWVKVPFRMWRNPEAIKLKKEKNGKVFGGEKLFFLRLLDGDTLLISLFQEGRYHKLQLLVKGEPSLFREIKAKSNNYFIRKKNLFEQWDRSNIQESIFRVLNVSQMPFSKRIVLYNDFFMRGKIEQLNTPRRKKISEILALDKRKKISGELALHNWRYDISLLFSRDYDKHRAYQFSQEAKSHFQIGIERNFTKVIPHLSFRVQFTYHSSVTKDIYWIYDREIKASFWKIYCGAQLELRPRKNISPYILGGYVFSIPRQLERTLVATGNTTLNGQPTFQVFRARVSPERGAFATAGFRFNVSEQTRLSLFYQIEKFSKTIDFRESRAGYYLFDLQNEREITPDEQLLGISLSRAF